MPKVLTVVHFQQGGIIYNHLLHSEGFCAFCCQFLTHSGDVMLCFIAGERFKHYLNGITVIKYLMEKLWLCKQLLVF